MLLKKKKVKRNIEIMFSVVFYNFVFFHLFWSKNGNIRNWIWKWIFPYPDSQVSRNRLDWTFIDFFTLFYQNFWGFLWNFYGFCKFFCKSFFGTFCDKIAQFRILYIYIFSSEDFGILVSFPKHAWKFPDKISQNVNFGFSVWIFDDAKKRGNFHRKT